MTLRSEREKSKMQEKYQLILSQMLKEEDNKYCVDCDTKSPRWASWNIGVFICIRCAGFHRNLGVHISKVKSINLDSWTAEQIASMQAMGNSRARAVYEANLPDGFRRPHADSALESFIRAKYEQRKWIAKEWIPPEITVPLDLMEAETNQRRVEIPTDSGRVEKSLPKLKPFAMPISANNPVQPSSPPPITSTVENKTQNLLNLDEPSSSTSNNSITISSPKILDPLQELYPTSQNINEENTGIESFEKALQNAFSCSNDITTSTSNGGVMSNEKIMALFNIPPTSTTATVLGMNIRASQMQAPNLPSPGFAYPPLQHSHQKSASFGNNLSQQSTHFGSHNGYPTQQTYPFQSQPGMSPMNHNGLSAPALQIPVSSFTQEQLNTQFSQLMPFANTKSNTSAAAIIANMPMRPVTEYMPASSDSLWQ